MLNRDVVQRIAALPAHAWTGRAYRQMAPKYTKDPTSGEGARILGGRWNPTGLAALYASDNPDAAVAELARLAERNARSPHDYMPRVMVELDVALASILDLRHPDAQAALGITMQDTRSDDLSRCQAIGEAAHYLGREAVIAPSAAADGCTLAIYKDTLGPDATIQVVSSTTWTTLPPPT